MADVELSLEQVREKLKDHLIKMGRHVSMAAFVPSGEPATPHSVENNGTFSLLELRNGKFIVTNCHVWDTFVQRRAADPGYRISLMGAGFRRPIDVSDAELVDSDEGIDLAVLRYDPAIIESVGKVFYRPQRWPLDTAKEGDDVALVGFPGNRRFPNDDSLLFESVYLNLKVTSLNDRKVRLEFTNPKPDVVNYSAMPITDFRWGGMSGSMVYRLDPALQRFFVTGFLHAAGKGLEAIFYASRADLIQEDGTIRHRDN